MRKLIYVAGIVAILAAALVVVPRALPNPLPAASPAPEADPVPTPEPAEGSSTITWSVPQLMQAMFPGSSSTATISFSSDQNLAGVAVDITPSLNGIVSANPASFPSISAKQNYQITLTLTAPPAFIKRSFGGTIHVRNAGTPPRTYNTPLHVNLQTDFLIFSNPTFGFSIAYPTSLAATQPDLDSFLFAPPALPSGGDEVSGVSIIITPNPSGGDVLSQYENLLAQSGGVYATGSTNGVPYYQFDPFVTEAGGAIIIVQHGGYFLELRGPSDESITSVIPSLTFQ